MRYLIALVQLRTYSKPHKHLNGHVKVDIPCHHHAHNYRTLHLSTCPCPAVEPYAITMVNPDHVNAYNDSSFAYMANGFIVGEGKIGWRWMS